MNPENPYKNLHEEQKEACDGAAQAEMAAQIEGAAQAEMAAQIEAATQTEAATQIEAATQTEAQTRTLKNLVNTPFKKAMFLVQIISYILIPGSPLIGGAIGGFLGLKTGQIAGLVLGIFIAGEILFYGSLIFLGKEVVLLVRDRLKNWFRKRRRKPENR